MVFMSVLLGSVSGCAAIDTSRSRPVHASMRPHTSETTTYRIQPGDTLTSIARDFGVSPEAIMGANRLDDPHYLRVGQRIKVPRFNGRPVRRSVRPQYASAPSPVPAPANASRDAVNARAAKPASRLPAPKPVPLLGALGAPELAGDIPGDAARTTRPLQAFMWPVRGPVIARFGVKASGQRNDGINIAAEANSPVKAADAGEVIYAGNELRSYGNLLLIRHASGYITAYAHNQTLLVARSDKVSRGQKIATVGSTGGVSKPQLHFEVRRGGKPVDPAPYLVTETASR
jgi:murein DD-endopeptidase MepM/ murein hydrolase activator NlpD